MPLRKNASTDDCIHQFKEMYINVYLKLMIEGKTGLKYFNAKFAVQRCSCSNWRSVDSFKFQQFICN